MIMSGEKGENDWTQTKLTAKKC